MPTDEVCDQNKHKGSCCRIHGCNFDETYNCGVWLGTQYQNQACPECLKINKFGLIERVLPSVFTARRWQATKTRRDRLKQLQERSQLDIILDKLEDERLKINTGKPNV